MAEQYIKPHVPNAVPKMENVDICGLSARFPESSSGSEFYRNLVSGLDMVNNEERKWKHFMNPGIPQRGGKMKKNEMYCFDAQFFGIHGQQAKKMDPQIYKLLEVSYEAWIDSGIDVRALRDSNRVGVYTGTCGSEVHGEYIRHKEQVTGYEQTGCVMSMTANRLSYFYSFRGPSKTCDTACSSAAMSLHDAIADITAGRIDYAVVCGSCNIQAPNMTLAFNNLHMLSPEGACKAFDAAGNGYVRSEGIAAIVLQRSDLVDVPRWAAVSPYCTIHNIGINNDGFTKEGITFPSRHAQFALEQQVCNMAKVNPAEVTYVEAHGTGTVAGDGQELDAIDRFYGRADNRAAPLLIGSVKSNMGHCEGCSCMAGVIKVCLALEYGMMPGNLHYHRDTPNPDSAGLRDGTLEVVDSTRPFEGGYVALSSFGFGGANMHMVMSGRGGQRINLLQSDSSSSDESVSEDAPADVVIPLAARTSEGLAYLAKIVNETEAADGISFAEPLRRYANSVANDMKLAHRGTLTNGELKAGSAVNSNPQVWFAFSGNGSQWPKMGVTLLNSNPIFQRAITACAAVVKPFGIDLLAEFHAEKGWKTPVLASVGLIAVQIGLVDILREEYGIVPDGMLGHSAGEIGCTYASGCCTKEQAMLIAYHRGRLPIQHGINTGLMAATGLSAAEAIERCAGTNVVMACDNSPTSTTISGPAEEVRQLVKQLEAENIFARALDTNGVPYHSSVLQPLLPELDKCLKEVMPNPQQRPAGWVSAAFEPESDLADASICSAGYQVHSYRNPVLFTGAAQQIPKDSLLVEIGPHSILRSPLRQCRPDLGYVNVMRKGECGVQSLATAVGDMWRKGVAVQWKADGVPETHIGAEVPRAIREALTSWDRILYDVPFVVGAYPEPGNLHTREYDLGGKDSYICDHAIDGNVFIPLSCFLVTAWDVFAEFDEKTIWDCPVEFTNVSVYQPVQVERTEKVVLGVLFDYKSQFSVVHNGELICSGTLKKYDVEMRLSKESYPYDSLKFRAKPPKELTGVDPEQFDFMAGEHWYSMCLRQNLQYGPKFRMVTKYSVDRTWSALRWDKNWIIHLDGLFQTTDRKGDYDVHVAKGLRRLAIVDTMKDVETGYEEILDTDTNWRFTRGRSMILQNFQDEIAPAKHKAAKTLVHKLEWQPYGDRVADDVTRTAYAAKLTRFVKQLLDKSTSSNKQLLKVKALFESFSGQPLTAEEIEVLTDNEFNRLATIFSDVLGSSEPPASFENAISQHSGLGQAQLEDPFLSSFKQQEVENVLGIAVGNQKTSGYTVGEIYAENNAFTKKAVETFITVPQSSMRSYTAIGKASTSEVTKAVPHGSLAYKAWDLNKPKGDAPGPFNILVASHLSGTAAHLPTALAHLYDNVSEGGFLFLEEYTSPLGAAVFGLDEAAWEHKDGRKYGPCTSVAHWKQLLAAAGFAEVSIVRRPADVSALLLYRKVSVTPPKAIVLEAPVFAASEAEMDEWLKNYLAALDQVDPDTEDSEPGTVWLYGDTVNHPGMMGFLTSARKEYKGDRTRAVVSHEPGVDFSKLIQSARGLDMVINYYKKGYNGYYAPVQTKYSYLKEESASKHGAHLNFDVYGKLNSWVWRENQPVPDNIPGIIKCNVAFGALNFRDVMLAYGKLSKQQMAHESGGDNIGFEFSGTIEGTNTRVMGSAKNALATKVVTRKDLTWVIPDSWSLAEAATVPTAYMTAYYSMVMRGRVAKGKKVLIHSGTGAVGMAAIQICLNRGAEVFTTVGSASKRKFLLETFPGLRDDHIGDSRSESFEGLVRNMTRGKGVHLCLNSLSDEKLQASVRCLGNWGKLLEIGKYDILQGTPLSMRPMLNNISFEGIDVDRVMNHPESTELAELNALVAAGLASGEVKPLPVTVYPRTEVEEAFRYLASGVHIGKVMVDVTANPEPQHTNNCLGIKKQPAPQNGHQSPVRLPPLRMQPTLHFRPDRSYIITGGLGGFGMAVFEFLAAYGANNIVVTSKRGVRSGNQQIALQSMYNKKINFRVTTLDVGVPEEAEQIVKLAESLAPVGGVFHLAMYLADKLITNQSGESWRKVMHAKANGGINMDLATRHCKELEHFVMWSSFVASAGNEGQTNYGYANACLDNLAEKRRALGLPSLSIQWGVIDHVGVADAAIQELMASGLLGAAMAQPIDDCLKTLGQLMIAGPLQAPVMTSSWQPLDLLGKSSGGEAKDLLQAILGVMGLTAAEVNDSDTLSRLGIDSMQLVEAKSNLQRALGRPVALEEASGMSIGEIKALEGDSGGAEAAPAGAPEEAAPAEAAPPPVETGRGSVAKIYPAKLIDLEHDLPVRLPVRPSLIKVKDGAHSVASVKKGIKSAPSTASLNAPPTPDRQSDLMRPSRYSGDSTGFTSLPESRSTSPELLKPAAKAQPAVVKPPAARKLNGTATPAAAAQELGTKAAAAASTAVAALNDHAFSWLHSTRLGFGFMMTMIFVVMGFGLQAASSIADKFGLIAVLPLLPVIYLAAGFSFALVTVLLKSLLLPRVPLNEPVKMFTPEFLKWWLVSRCVDLTNILVMKHFRGTVVLNYYFSLLGANVDDTAFIDTLDVMDFDCLVIGKNAVLGEGATVLAHTFKDGFITYSKVVIGAGTQIQPYGVVTPATELQEGQELTPHAKASTKPSLKSAKGLAVAFENVITGTELNNYNHTIAQLAALLLPLLLASVAAFVGCITFEKALASLGVSIKLPAFAYTATAITAMSNPILAIFAAIMLPAEGTTAAGIASAVPAALASFVALPIAWFAYALTLVALASFAKHIVTGRIEAGVHKRNTSYGVAFWASQRLMELTYLNVSSVFMGTWALNGIYRIFGASIGGYTSFRKVPAITVPDMIKMGKLVVNGDTCKIAASIAVDSTSIACAPIKIGDQGTVGASSVILPGTTVGAQATLAPLAAPAVGSTVEPLTINIGAPSAAVKVVKRPAPVLDIQLPMHVLAQALPFLQVITVTTIALAAHLPTVAGAIYLRSYNPGLIGSIVALIAAYSYMGILISKLGSILQAKTSIVNPEAPVRQWTMPYIVSSGVTAATIYLAHFGDALWRGAPGWIKSLRQHTEIGEGCYIDADWAGEPGMGKYGDGVIVDRGAIVFGHLMTHNGEAFYVNFGKVNLASGAVVSARSGIFPGANLKAGEVIPSGEMKMAA